jgi:hypothetical protein
MARDARAAGRCSREIGSVKQPRERRRERSETLDIINYRQVLPLRSLPPLKSAYPEKDCADPPISGAMPMTVPGPKRKSYADVSDRD